MAFLAQIILLFLNIRDFNDDNEYTFEKCSRTPWLFELALLFKTSKAKATTLCIAVSNLDPRRPSTRGKCYLNTRLIIPYMTLLFFRETKTSYNFVQILQLP